MRRAVQPAAAVAEAVAPKTRGRARKVPTPKEGKVTVVRICDREGCGKQLKPSNSRFCTNYCKTEFLNGPQQHYTKYKPEFATTVLQAYLDECDKGHEPTLIPTESSYILIHNARMPTYEDYAEYLEKNFQMTNGLRSNTLTDWAELHPPFAHALERIKRVQKTFLLNNGLSGRYNSVISKLGLVVNHGMIETEKVEHSHQMLGVVRHIYEEADKKQATPKQLDA